MYPILFTYGSLVLPSWHVLFVLAVAAAFWAMQRVTQRYYPQLSQVYVLRLYFWAYLGAYLGARWLSVVVEQPEISGIGAQFLAGFSLGPLTFYGGVLGGAAAGLTYGYWRRLPLAALADIILPALFIGVAIGRIGCFLNGDDYGLPVPVSCEDLAPWWAVKFRNHDPALYRYPVQLWESAGGLLIFLAAQTCYRRPWVQRQAGSLGLLCCLVYGVLRFGLEYWRDDPRGWFFGSAFSTSQGLSGLLVCFCGGFLFHLFLHARHKAH